MLANLSSISTISRVIDTAGSYPVVVMAEDIEEYACKYDAPSKLINEYIGYQFLQLWGFELFPAAFIQIKREHVPDNILGGRIQIPMFERPAFGLLYNNNAGDINNALLGLRKDSYEIAKFEQRFEELMKIGLFDLWLANDDRNHNNYNLLTIGNRFIPIDHSNLFDGNGLGRKLSPLTWEDSVLSSDLAITFLNNRKKMTAMHDELLENFPIFVTSCKAALSDIVLAMPDVWCNDKADLIERISTSVIDNPAWIQQTNTTFSELIHNFNR